MIEFQNVTKRYQADEAAVDNLSFTIPDGNICVLVGPSGCGKTTTMRMVNRLIEPTSGDILIDGKPNTSMDQVQLRRGIGYVIQQVGLFPHRTIGQNVATVPKLLRWKQDELDRRVDDLLSLVGLKPELYRDRYPSELSGGQQQRVGVARALAADPPIMLMDEPFGAVDPIARERLQDEFLGIQQRVHKTIIFVTHDIDEAIKMGDRIVILKQGGVLAQYDTPERLLMKPNSEFVASFVGSDRAIKRLSLLRVDDLATEDATARRAENLPRISSDRTAEEALSLLLDSRTDRALVSPSGDTATRIITMDAIRAVFRESGDETRGVESGRPG